jgi:hypothetical protein
MIYVIGTILVILSVFVLYKIVGTVKAIFEQWS